MIRPIFHRRYRAGLSLLAALLLTTTWCPMAALAQDAAHTDSAPPCPNIKRLFWQTPQRIRWQLAQTPLWFSVGHVPRVMCWVAVGVAEKDGAVVTTYDGSGAVYEVRVEIHDVTAFDGTTGAPSATKLAYSETIRADDKQALERRTKWGFPTEQGKDFEFGLLPALQHQRLFRIFLHGEALLWQTLMVHTEAALAPMPAPLAKASGSAMQFTELRSHTIVCELLNDPDLPLTSTYIESGDLSSREWIKAFAVAPPWAAGKSHLEPALGSVEFDAGKVATRPLNERGKLAQAKLEFDEYESKLPRFSTGNASETDFLNDLQETTDER